MFKRRNNGAILIETAFILPLLLLLVLGIIEVYRMRVAERFVENAATDIGIDLSSRRAENEDIIKNIIKKCNAENSIMIMSNDAEIRNVSTISNDNKAAKFQYCVALQGNHDSATLMVQDLNDSTYDRGDMIMVSCCLKYEFLAQLTKMAFMGGKDKDLFITKKYFIKCL